MDGIHATLQWTVAEKVKQIKTVINATIQLFKHSTINVTSLSTDVLQHNVENPLFGKMLKILLLSSIRQGDLWGHVLRIFFKICSLGTRSWSLWLKWSFSKSPLTGQWPTFARY